MIRTPGAGGLGVLDYSSSAFRDPNSSVGAPGPGSTLNWFAGGGGGGVYNASNPAGEGGGSWGDLCRCWRWW